MSEKEKLPIQKIRELRRLKQKELAALIVPPEKVQSMTMTISYLENGKRRLTEDFLDKFSKALQCTKLQLLGEEEIIDDSRIISAPRPQLAVKNEYPIKDQYIRYSMEIVDDLVDAQELTKEGRVEILSQVYKVVYDFYENNHSKEEYKQFVKDIEERNTVNKGFLNFINKHKKELY